MTKLYFETEAVAQYLDGAKRDLFLARIPERRASRVRSPRNEEKRAERAAAEVALRRVCKRAGEDYTSLFIGYTDNGKPYIEGRPDLAISISHTPHLAGAALVKASDIAPDIGLDLVSAGSAPARCGDIAARFFSDSELAELGTPLPDMQSEAFLRAWCRCEARVKMSGVGLGDAKNGAEPRALRRATLTLAGLPCHYVAIALSEDAEDA